MVDLYKNPVIIFLSAVVLVLLGVRLSSLYQQRNRPTEKAIINTISQDKNITTLLPQNKPQISATPSAETASIKVKPEDAVLGNASAKVTIIEFGDFQCPFCGRFFREVEPQLKKDYIETGKASFVYKHLAFLGKESVDAANASLCAKEQSKFWEYHDKLYQTQKGENQGAFALPALKQFAKELGLNSSQFDNCLDSQNYAAQVQVDTTEINSKGYFGTPTTFINDTVVVGAQPYVTFKAVIDEKLASQP